MTTVNEKGGHHLSLTVLQTELSEVNCMLKDQILKKSENYAIQLVDFVLSKQALINPNIHLPFLEIKHYERLPADIVDLPAIYGTRTVFTPKNCTSVVELFRQLKRFCVEFSTMWFSYGLGDGKDLYVPDEYINDHLTNAQRANTPVNIDDGQYNPLEDVLSVSLDADLKLRFHFGQLFCQDFYLELSDYASEIVGFPKQLFHVVGSVGGGDLFTNTATLANPIIFDGTDLVDADNAVEFRVVIEDVTEEDFGTIFQSTESIKNFDERLSLDLISTFPCSRKVCILNGIQTEEYLLGRFDLSDFRDFKISGTTQNDNITYTVTEKFHPAAFNLTKGFPNYESNHFLNGPLQSVNFKLLMRYIDGKKKIKSIPLDMKDGYYQIKCQFSKKI